MNLSQFEESANKRLNLSVFVWVTLIFSFFLLNQCNSSNHLKKEISKLRRELKTDYEQRIEKRDSIIQSLEKDNKFKKIQISKMIDKIDSLEKVKVKIRIKYVDRIREIRVMDSEEIKNYWNEQFN
jgi:biopolymer transport protein ExbB/TolQ